MKNIRNLYFLLFVALASVYLTSLRFHFNSEFHVATFHDIVDGRAQTPFQYRFLVPLLVKSTYQILGVPLEKNVLLKAFSVIEACSVFFLVVCFRAYLNLFLRNYEASSLLALTILPALPFHFLLFEGTRFWYSSDVPAILFLVMLSWALYKQRWQLFYLIFSLATLNRETSIFATVLMILTLYDRLPKRHLLLHIIMQILIWVIVKAALHYLFIDNPGEFFQQQFVSNLKFLTSIDSYLLFTSASGFLLVPVLTMRRLITDDFARRSILLVYPFFFGMLLVGHLWEFRIFAELIPITLTGYAMLLNRFFQESKNLAISG